MNIKNRSYYEALNIASYVDYSKFRIGQRGAFNCIVEKVVDHAKTISIVLPTRYGKSDVIRCSAIELIERGLCSNALLAAPCKFLRDQLIAKNKVEEMIHRYSVNTCRPISYDMLDNFRLPIFQNNEHFVGLTTQMLATNDEPICDYIESQIQATGKPILLYIDESHCQSDVNTWGCVVPKAVAAGAIVILCTATPFRDDGRKIPGFECITELRRERERSIPRKHIEEDKYWIDRYLDIEGDLRLRADYDYSFKQAWAEGNVICKIMRNEFDVVVKIPDRRNDDTKEVRISKVTPAECSKYFGRVVRDAKVIQQGVTDLLNRFNDYKLLEPNAQAIIFCGNDIDGQDDGHAKQIATEIACQAPRLQTVIATSKQENSDDLIKRFSNGTGDILIVKQMASLGLDIPSIKIALDLSAVRTLAAYVQRVMRIATIWNNSFEKHISYLITPADINGVAMWNGFIDGNGGAMATHESTLLESVEKIKEPDDKDTTFEVLHTESSVISDNSSTQRIAQSEYNDFAKPLIAIQPKLQAIFTDQEIIELGRRLGKEALSNARPSSPPEATLDVTEKRKLLRNKINYLTKQIASSSEVYTEDAPDKWVRANATAMNEAKQAAGVKLGVELNQIASIDVLQRMVNFLTTKLPIQV